jgi:hypothetical protein
MMDSTPFRQARGRRTGSRLAGAALAALVTLAGCGNAFHERLEGGRHLPPGPGPGPAAPVLSAPPAYTAHQNGYRASATVPDGFACAWAVTGGTLAGPADGAEVVFTAGEPGTLTLTCTFSDGTVSRTQSASAPVRTGPILTVPDRSVLRQGTDTLSTPAVAGASYRWSVAGARILRGQGTPRILVDNGGTASAALRAVTPGSLALEAPGRLLVTLEETGPDGGVAATTLEIPEQAENGLAPARLVYDPGVLVAIAGSAIEEVVQDLAVTFGKLPVSVRPRFVYGANSRADSVFSYALDPDTGGLSDQGGGPVPNVFPQLVVDPTGRFLFLAARNQVAAFAVDRDTGLLSAPATGATQATRNSAANGMVVDPAGQNMYVIYSGIGVGGDGIWLYAIDPLGGGLDPLSPATLTPPVANLGLTGLAVDPAGRFLYTASYYGDGAVFARQYGLDSTGQPGLAQDLPILGYGHKSLVADPSGRFLLEVNSLDMVLDVLALDPDTGTPVPTFNAQLTYGPFVLNMLPPVVTATVR